jgi:predicted nuclease with TOPRIM domain
MLEEYLKGADHNAGGRSADFVPADSPPIENAKIGVDCERIDSLLGEIDSLKDRLTESECKMSKLLEEKESLDKELEEFRECAAKVEEEKLKGKFHSVELETKCKSLEVELSLVKELLRDLPSVELWRSTVEKLRYMESQQKKDTEQLLSQIHTLEVQKEDAEAELTRLRSAIKYVPESTRAPSVVSCSSKRFGGLRTVCIFGNPETPSLLSTRRSSLAEEFVNLSLIKRL